MATCNPCVTSNLPTIVVDNCNLNASLMKSGIEYLIFVKCGTTMVAVSSASEWTTLLAANNGEVTKLGSAVFPKPEFEKYEIANDSNSKKLNINGKTMVNFKSALLDPTTDTHNDFINEFNEAAGSYNLLFIGADGYLYYRYDWVTITNPGFGINDGLAFLADEGKMKKLNLDIEIQTQVLYKSIPLTTALRTAFGI